jgi:hypothetical protein
VSRDAGKTTVLSRGDISYWGVAGRRLMALLLGADDRMRIARPPSHRWTSAPCDEFY